MNAVDGNMERVGTARPCAFGQCGGEARRDKSAFRSSLVYMARIHKTANIHSLSGRVI